MEVGSLFVLPSYLLERIRLLLADDVDLPPDLRRRLSEMSNRAEYNLEETSLGLADAAVEQEDGGGSSVASENAGADAEALKVGPSPPPTIAVDLVEDLSRWAGLDRGGSTLKAKGIDPNDYSLISLLAGTEVYIPPKQLALLKAADNPEKPNPYLPSHLSPRPPVFAGYRALSKQMSTVLNILFSTFGSGGAVYVAGTTGAGYSRETSVILGVLAGVCVGLAEIVLVWILVWRVDEGRKKEVEQWKGSSALGSKNGDLLSLEGGTLEDQGPDETLKEKKTEVRLRRRAINPANSTS